MSVIVLSDYSIQGVIAKGQNTVLRVKNVFNQKEYALKKIRRVDFDKHLIDLQEILHLMNCTHPNIMKILGFTMSQQKIDSYKSEYILCILMDIMNKTLESDIKERNKLQNFYKKEEILKILQNLISACVYMQNEIKLAHRDIKPENILMNNEGEILLTDFSESFMENEIKLSARTLVGSPFYMSPELREIYVAGDDHEGGNYNPWKSDVYSAGITILDCCELSIGERKLKEEKLKNVAEKYGDSLAELINLMIFEDSNTRPDFNELVKSNLYTNLFGEFKENKFSKEEKEKSNKNSLAEEFLELIEALKSEIENKDEINQQEIFDLFLEIQSLESEKEINSKKEQSNDHFILNELTSNNYNKPPSNTQ